MKSFFFINTHSLPIFGNFWYTARKFASGFEQLGFRTLTINSDKELRSIPDSYDHFCFVGDTGVVNGTQESTMEILRSMPKMTKIFWFFQNYFTRSSISAYGRVILTGEPFLKRPQLFGHVAAWEKHQNLAANYLPLLFLSCLPIQSIGSMKRQSIWTAQFVGAGYKSEWTSKLTNCFIRNTPPEIAEEERIQSFLDSDIALGLSSNANILNSVVTERVAEALSLGNVVISDNPAAPEFTDGVAEYASSYEQMCDKISYFKYNKQAYISKQQEGYKWARAKGTYTHLAKQFIEKSKSL